MPDRGLDLAGHLVDLARRLAAYCSVVVTVDARGLELPRLVDQPLAASCPARPPSGARRRAPHRHGADGRRLRRRHAARRLHAVSARHHRLDRGGLDRAALGRHVRRRRAAHVWFPPIDWPPSARRWHRAGRRAAGPAAAAAVALLSRRSSSAPSLISALGVPCSCRSGCSAFRYMMIGWAIGLNFTRADPASRGARAAADRRLDPGPDGVLRRPRLAAQP